MPATNTVAELLAYPVYDSRGQPTIEAKLTTLGGIAVTAAVPSGASTGIYEAVELRDGISSDHHGKSVHKAVSNVNEILAPAVVKSGLAVDQQYELDQLAISLDKSENKSNLGANAILAASVTYVKASAQEQSMPIYRRVHQLAASDSVPSVPIPFFNVINGGAHADNLIAFQEFMVAPIGAGSFSEAMRMGSEVYSTLKALIKKKYGSKNTNVGDEGGFAPDIASVEECLELLVEAIAASSYTGKVSIALDVAASEFHMEERPGFYDLDSKDKAKDLATHRILSGEQMVQYYLKLINSYPIISIEDPFDQNDWASWSSLTASTSIQIVGDDLTVTNPKRIQMAIDRRACNALLLKINQIGTVTESIAAAKLARSAGWNVMVSHRSGETEDTFIADLAVGLGAGQIKSGAPCRSERVAKYNRILRIEYFDKNLSYHKFGN